MQIKVTRKILKNLKENQTVFSLSACGFRRFSQHDYHCQPHKEGNVSVNIGQTDPDKAGDDEEAHYQARSSCPNGTPTKRPSTKRPCIQNVLPTKRPSTKRPSTERPIYKTSLDA
jgi:hypothetical protein